MCGEEQLEHTDESRQFAVTCPLVTPSVHGQWPPFYSTHTSIVPQSLLLSYTELTNQYGIELLFRPFVIIVTVL